MFLHSALHVIVGSGRYHTQLLKPWRNFPLWAQTTSYPLFLLPVWGSTLWASLPVNDTQTFPSQPFQRQSSSLNLCSFFFSPSHIALTTCSRLCIVSPCLALTALCELAGERSGGWIWHQTGLCKSAQTQHLTSSTTTLSTGRAKPLCYYKWLCAARPQPYTPQWQIN